MLLFQSNCSWLFRAIRDADIETFHPKCFVSPRFLWFLSILYITCYHWRDRFFRKTFAEKWTPTYIWLYLTLFYLLSSWIKEVFFYLGKLAYSSQGCFFRVCSNTITKLMFLDEEQVDYRVFKYLEICSGGGGYKLFLSKRHENFQRGGGHGDALNKYPPTHTQFPDNKLLSLSILFIYIFFPSLVETCVVVVVVLVLVHQLRYSIELNCTSKKTHPFF